MLGIRNIVSTLFIAEAHYNLPMLQELLLALYDNEPDRETVSLFLNWFQQLANYGRIDEKEYGSLETAIRTKEEVSSMLPKALERERAKLRDEVRNEVRVELQDEVRSQIREEIRTEQMQQIARTMLAQNFAVAQIADLTGLSLEQVTRLQVAMSGSDALPRNAS